MVLNMKGNILKEKNMDMEYTNGQMAPNMMENGKIISYMDK
jgi:hypothetical protein